MTDPYKVLGVSQNATDEEVKAAYRELARKYHPDAYVNNPLADLASEKMKEINEAYDAIVSMRKNGTGPSYSQSGSAAGTGYTSSQFADIRRLIHAGRIVDAEELLNGVPVSGRDAEWSFLKGSIFYSRGWLDEAYNYFAKAVELSPSNPEYRAALNQMAWQRNGNMHSQNGAYRTGAPVVGCSCCDCCSGLICTDCCCESMGCDFCPCI